MNKEVIIDIENPKDNDLISRQAVLDCLTATGLKKYDFILNAMNKIKSLPSIKPQTGHWIRITNGGAMKQIYLCSECRRRIEDDGIEALITIKYPYCHCGARMEVEQI